MDFKENKKICNKSKIKFLFNANFKVNTLSNSS